jgi:hypothetical protein
MENLQLDEFKFIRYKSVSRLSALLRKWININYHMAASWKWKDCPWWYNECASVSVFTTAVLKAGGLALEEFCDEKIYQRSRYIGRCDLYFEFGGKKYTAETKHIWSATGPRANATISHITNALVTASNDVQHIKML